MSAKIFKDFNGTKEQFATWLAADPSHAEKVANSVVFIHDPADENATGGWIYANGVYYACEENNGGVLDEDLVINGGPLAPQFNQVFSDSSVPQGTSFKEIVSRLILKDNWPTVKDTYNFTASVSKPSITLSPAKGSTVEVGSSVSWSTTDTKDTGAVGNKQATIYREGDGYLSESSTGSSPFTTKNYTLSPTEDSTTQAYSVTVKGASASGVSGSFVADSVGTHTVATSVTGSKFSYSFSKTVYKKSNTGKVDVSNPVVCSKSDSKTPTNSDSASVTAKYYGYVGFTNDSSFLNLDGAAIKSGYSPDGGRVFLESSGETNIFGVDVLKTTTGKSMYIAVPDGYSLKDIENDMHQSIKGNFAEQSTRTVAIGGTSTKTYNVYFYKVTSGTTQKYQNVVIKKD